ncbi:Crp/Fnr family transcriptional regulator [Flavobacterium cellulosilyticum]|uniref:Crp/Fnr family transcriptional regulator n=1 Tax=Flavobacterium cellulosilyticum TaxID=2541731 RepID=A0A4R5C8U5_9FLAO|nr:Crp/Fnr family transcriptional regulator [Flavobacterium cellulosilyticum]TDD96218.1 Crp/Fnr family transcriptional regulator [Flavobacterium cellulosilyticum]
MKNINADCSVCTNSNCFIKKHLHLEKMQDYVMQKINFSCKKGQQFMIEGAPMQGLYFIFSGKAKVIKTGIYGKEQIVRLAKEGDTLGFRGFGTKNRYLIAASAIEDTVLCNFSNEVMQGILKNIPEFTYDMMLFYAQELNKSENNVKKIAQMNVRERVIDALLYLHKKFGQSNGLIDITLSRKEIADFTGTTDEQITRILSSLKKEGLIKIVEKKIGLLDTEKMQREIIEHK